MDRVDAGDQAVYFMTGLLWSVFAYCAFVGNRGAVAPRQMEP
jgi:hypothetical protein